MPRNRSDDDSKRPTLAEAWQTLGQRHGLSVDVLNDESILASGDIRGRLVTVDIHRERKASEPFQVFASALRRGRMRRHWTTEVTVACSNPRRVTATVESFKDIDDPSWDPRNFETSHCRVVRTEPESLAAQVLTESIATRLASLFGDRQILIEQSHIRFSSTSKVKVEGGYFVGSPIHVDHPLAPPPWPERALVGPVWWIDLLCDIAEALES